MTLVLNNLCLNLNPLSFKFTRKRLVVSLLQSHVRTSSGVCKRSDTQHGPTHDWGEKRPGYRPETCDPVALLTVSDIEQEVTDFAIRIMQELVPTRNRAMERRSFWVGSHLPAGW